MTTSKEQPRLILRLTPTELQQLVAGEFIVLTLVVDGSSTKDAREMDRLRLALEAWGLSPRQMQIVLLDWQGFTRTEIMQRLEVSSNTVDWHWRKINARLGVSNRASIRALMRSILAQTTDNFAKPPGD